MPVYPVIDGPAVVPSLRTLGTGANQAMPGNAVVGSAITQLFDSTLSGTAANFDLTSISGSYNHLFLVAIVRSTGAVQNENSLIRFNNDSGANYDYNRVAGNASAVGCLSTAGGTSFAVLFRNTGSTATAGRYAMWRAQISDYASAVPNKIIQGESSLFATTGTAQFIHDVGSGLWRNTAVLTQITILPGSGSWDVGSRVTLYGML